MPTVRIRLAGRLDKQWLAWLDGFTMAHGRGHETILSGRVRDSAALYGIIAKLRDLGLTLISVNPTRARPKRRR